MAARTRGGGVSVPTVAPRVPWVPATFTPSQGLVLFAGRVARRARWFGGFRFLPEAEVLRSDALGLWWRAGCCLHPPSARGARSPVSVRIGRPPWLFGGCGPLSGLAAGSARGFGGWWVLPAGGGFEVRRPPTLAANRRFLGPRAPAGAPGRWEVPAGAHNTRGAHQVPWPLGARARFARRFGGWRILSVGGGY